ncbi:hypothetical protein MMC30_000026 [Trapelia coarctata]|nr:hypothetical protein [Trapelia coarctata]
MERRLQGRDFFDDGDVQAYNTSLIVRWVIFGIIVFCILALVFAYAHAKRRMQTGLPPKAYHRWMVPNQNRTRQASTIQNQFSFYRAGPSEYDLEAYPPPVYDPNHVMPPAYQPPEGASKANPSQDYDVPPPGAPPSQVAAVRVDNEAVIESPPPTARSVRSPWLSKFKRST